MISAGSSSGCSARSTPAEEEVGTRVGHPCGAAHVVHSWEGNGQQQPSPAVAGRPPARRRPTFRSRRATVARRSPCHHRCTGRPGRAHGHAGAPTGAGSSPSARHRSADGVPQRDGPADRVDLPSGTFSSRCTARATDANASFASRTSMSSTVSAGLSQRPQRGGHHADPRARVHAASRSGDEPAAHRKPQLLGPRLARDERQGRAVVHAAGVGGGDRPVLVEPGRSRARPSAVASGRMCSSVVKSTVRPSSA